VHKDITGIILAGGKSLRMGRDKGLLQLGGKAVIEIISSTLQELFPQILISTDAQEEYAFLGLPTISDRYKYIGPLAGIHSALSYSTTTLNLVISCDLPLMNAAMIEYLIECRADEQIVIARTARHLQFFPGLYDKRLLPAIEEIVTDRPSEEGARDRGFSLYALSRKVKTAVVDPAGMPFFRNELYLNLNTPADYEEIARILATSRGFK
jgi:molybdopterin-guanine dinucleotide biosynthesis protein A